MEKVREKIHQRLMDDGGLDEGMGTELEEQLFIFNEKEDTATYIQHARTIIASLADPQNDKLRRDIQKGKYTMKEIVEMQPKDLCPYRWYEAYTEAKKKDKDRLMEAPTSSGVSSFIQCKFCKGHQVEFTLLQTRSADEGMTAFYYCYDCRKRWKGS